MGLRNKAVNAKVVEEKNIYLVEPEKGLDLCSSIISEGEVLYQVGLNGLDGILENFMDISQTDSNTTGVETYKNLIELREDLINILNFPKLENNYTVAVGGSFSAGKSTFLNKVLGLHDVLPTDTNPTTSISSYVTKGDENRYRGLNIFNNTINLDKEAIQAISHAFNKKYNVSFSHILKLISIEQKDLKYDDLVFLDTPGYSKADDINQENNIDENVARDHLRTTDFLIWLVDCQTPISEADMNFLQTLDLKNPILVVLNKADKKLPEDVLSQVEKSKSNLIKHNIPTYDVVGYSSTKEKEYSPSGDVIERFLEQVSLSNTGTKILNRAKNIFDTYMNYYDSQLTEYRTTRGVLNKIIMEEAVDIEYQNEITMLASKRQKQIRNIEKSKSSIVKLAKELDSIITELLQMRGLNIVDTDTFFEFEKVLHSDGKVKKRRQQTFKFPANLYIKDHHAFLKYKDLNEIEAKVYKISSIGVFVKIDGVQGEIMISKSKVLQLSEVSSVDDVFAVEDSVTVQVIDKKRCVITKG